ncbi:ATP-binding cassette domain-containing protein [Roseateles sp. DC23W]|uniref:ATP-binding cassette domain-containing protein n=1 Tax=Pelomonas dachongensis TaxID=3299029 RepID=A0ABW7EH78_9BURK
MLRLRALHHRRGRTEVLRDVDLDVMPGEVLAIVGPRGAGKSTLLRCLAGLQPRQHGSLMLAGRLLPPGGPLPAQMALLCRGLDLLPGLSLGQNVMQAPALAGAADAAERARELLACVGLARQFDTLAGALSRGAQQRVVIARTLASEPAVLLCDDITRPRDPAMTVEVALALRTLATWGLTQVVVTEDAALARSADRVLQLRGGRLQPLQSPSPGPTHVAGLHRLSRLGT